MLSLEIVDEIIDSSFKSRLLSKKLIKRIVLEEIAQSDLYTQNGFEGVTFGTAGNSDGAYYNNKININIEKIKQKRPYMESDLRLNILTAQVILHEIEHLKEEAKLYNSEYFGEKYIESTEYKLLVISNNQYLTKRLEKQILSKAENLKKYLDDPASYKLDEKVIFELEKTRSELYKIIPNEKLAEFYSTNEILKSVFAYPDFKDNHFSEIKFLKAQIYETFLRGYLFREIPDIKIPLVDYLNAIGTPKVIESFDGYSPDKEKFLTNIKKIEPSHKKRMLYGLPAEKNEVGEIIGKYIALKR